MKTNDKIQPLNTALPEFFLDDMERRLETDPLTLGGLVDLLEPDELLDDACYGKKGCSCNGHEGACHGWTYCNCDGFEA